LAGTPASTARLIKVLANAGLVAKTALLSGIPAAAQRSV